MASEHLEIIKRKCEQYWNENRVEPPEQHAVLEFIHRHACDAQTEIARLRAALEEISKLNEETEDSSTASAIAMEALEALKEDGDGE